MSEYASNNTPPNGGIDHHPTVAHGDNFPHIPGTLPHTGADLVILVAIAATAVVAGVVMRLRAG